MRAIYYDAFRTPARLTTLPDPEPARDGVVVAVRATGLCRSDWHGWMGHDEDVQLPHVPGHEFAGEIVAVGAEVRHWSPGDRVTAPFCLGCGTCPCCRRGDHQICPQYEQPGFTYWGSFAEYVAIPYAETNLVRLPDAIDLEAAALLGCRFTTAFRALVQQGRLRPGMWVAVFGCGGVGLSAIMIARACGARVIGVDLNEEALRLARELGAEHTLLAGTGDEIVAKIRDLSQGGVDIGLDALGHPQTCLQSIHSLRRRGRHLQVGLLGGHHDPPLPTGRIIAHELEVLGSHGMAAHAFPALLDLIGSGRLDPKAMLGRTIGLEQAPEALARMDENHRPGVTLIQVD